MRRRSVRGHPAGTRASRAPARRHRPGAQARPRPSHPLRGHRTRGWPTHRPDPPPTVLRSPSRPRCRGAPSRRPPSIWRRSRRARVRRGSPSVPSPSAHHPRRHFPRRSSRRTAARRSMARPPSRLFPGRLRPFRSCRPWRTRDRSATSRPYPAWARSWGSVTSDRPQARGRRGTPPLPLRVPWRAPTPPLRPRRGRRPSRRIRGDRAPPSPHGRPRAPSAPRPLRGRRLRRARPAARATACSRARPRAPPSPPTVPPHRVRVARGRWLSRLLPSPPRRRRARGASRRPTRSSRRLGVARRARRRPSPVRAPLPCVRDRLRRG